MSLLHSLLVECALAEGFPLAGTVDLDLALADAQGLLPDHIVRYDQWIKAGHAGAMDYLARGQERRANPRLVFPEVQSILCVAIPYPRRPAGASHPEQGPRYARYLQGQDYHLEIQDKLERVMHSVKAKWENPDQQSPNREARSPLNWKICVDTSAVLERTWAALAGLGWIGKNSLLIHPKLGSYLFLAEVLINHKTGKGPQLLPNYCGHCTRCIKACPTEALISPGVLDSNRCVSYWTLEKRGELNLSETDQNKMGSWVAGCDICQEVCPFNIKPSQAESLEPDRNATSLNAWRDLLLETSDEYKLRVKNSALKRVKPAQFSRNLAMTLKQTILASNPQQKSLFQISLKPLVERRCEVETDPPALKAWHQCLEVF